MLNPIPAPAVGLVPNTVVIVIDQCAASWVGYVEHGDLLTTWWIIKQQLMCPQDNSSSRVSEYHVPLLKLLFRANSNIMYCRT